MDFLTSKAIMIGVGIFATLAITSSVIIILGYVLDIYGNVAKIDYRSLLPTGEYDRYNVSAEGSTDTMSGAEVYNMIKKVGADKISCYNGANKTNILNKNMSDLSANYKVIVQENSDGTVIIKVTKL